MGDWRDLVRSQMNEETGAVELARSKVAWQYASTYRSQIAMILFGP
jgi:hypothetical protein